MSPVVFSRTIDSTTYKGTISVNTGLFINGQYVQSATGDTLEYVIVFFPFPLDLSIYLTALTVISTRVRLGDRKSTRLNSSHSGESRMPSSA